MIYLRQADAQGGLHGATKREGARPSPRKGEEARRCRSPLETDSNTSNFSMPFQNQFSLSLELTRIAPVGLLLSKAGQALMSLARDLQDSGSGIVIGEDLANVFGRCRISLAMALSFKTIILQSHDPPTLSENGISLVSGVGPTVARAFQESPYYATIV